jgi:hypothetical protein
MAAGRASASSPSASPIALFEPDPKRRTALVVHLDATHESMLALMSDTELLRSVFHRVVYLTDHADFSILRENGCIFEYVPSRAQQLKFAPEAPWAEFLADRYDLLVAKWTPAATITFGPSVEVLVSRIGEEERAAAAARHAELQASHRFSDAPREARTVA